MKRLVLYNREATDDNTMACWIPKTTNTHSEYVIIIAFSQQQWLHERASMLLYTYIACLILCQHRYSRWSEQPYGL